MPVDAVLSYVLLCFLRRQYLSAINVQSMLYHWLDSWTSRSFIWRTFLEAQAFVATYLHPRSNTVAVDMSFFIQSRLTLLECTSDMLGMEIMSKYIPKIESHFSIDAEEFSKKKLNQYFVSTEHLEDENRSPSGYQRGVHRFKLASVESLCFLKINCEVFVLRKFHRRILKEFT